MQATLNDGSAEGTNKVLILLFDTLAFLFTVYKTWHQVYTSRLTGLTTSYSNILLRDGELSMLVLSVAPY